MSSHSIAVSHLPQSQVQHFKAWELRYPLQAPLGDLGTTVQIDPRQLGQVVGDQLQPFVCDSHTLSNVQSLEFVHLPYHPVDAVVTDVTGAQGQGLELVQPLGDVSQALVSDLITEGDIEPRQLQRAHGQMHYTCITDVIT